MSANINFPNPWQFEISPLDTSMAITELPKITTDSTFKGDVTSEMSIKGDVSTEMSISVKELPEIKFGITELPQIDLQFGIRPMRIHFPLHMTYCLNLFGQEVMSFSHCGEAMVVIENYEPHARELCR